MAEGGGKLLQIANQANAMTSCSIQHCGSCASQEIVVGQDEDAAEEAEETSAAVAATKT